VTTWARAGLFFVFSIIAFAQTPGLRNFHQVDEHIYRGAQPAVWGYRTLSSMGVKTVIDLRNEGISEAVEESMVKKHGMNFVNIPLDGHKPPSPDTIAQLLKILNDSTKWPVYIHCRRGADRTGTVIACYRIAHDNWDNKRALDEAESYEMDPGQKLMQQFILQFHLPTPTLTQ